MTAPRVAATRIPISMLRPTITASTQAPCHSQAIAPTERPQASPITRPMRISLSSRLPRWIRSACPVARPRTTMVEDCSPILPPIAMTTGMKMARTMYCSSICSWLSMMRPATRRCHRG